MRCWSKRSDKCGAGKAKCQVLGVDDFAFRKGCSYGTILVDLEKRKVIDLLPDRESETLKKWLLDHPEVETVSRDRSAAYAEAVRSGAPQAAQVAGWHLLKNLTDLLERILLGESAVLKSTAEAVRLNNTKGQSGNTLPIANLTSAPENFNPSPAETERKKLFKKIKQLSAEGFGIRQIRREIGICRNTVRKYLRSESIPQKLTGKRRSSEAAKYADYLQQRWSEGEQNAVQLWQEIRERGFCGGISSVRKFVQNWRGSVSGKISEHRVPA